MCQLDRVGVGGGGDAGLAAGGPLSHHTQLFQDIGCTFDMCLLTLPMMLPLLSLHPAARLSPRLTGVMVCETGREREREYAVSVSVCVTGINSGSETWQRCACVSAVPEIASLHVSMWQFLSRAQLIACFSAYLNA